MPGVAPCDAAGLDPIEFRRRNLRSLPARLLGQKIAPSDRLVEMLDAVGKRAVEKPRMLTGDKRLAIGTGFSLLHQGNGLGSAFPTPAPAA